MLQFQPEITLPDRLGISYPQEVLDWIKDNTSGMKYIAIKRILDKDEYKQLNRISIQDNPSANQKPEESPVNICETIYKILEYDMDGEEATGKYRLVIYRKMPVGQDKPITKHVVVNIGSSGDRESNVFDPRKRDNSELVDKQMEYIAQLQDTLAGMNNFASQIITPIIAMNEKLQNTNIEMGANMVRLKEIELIAEREREADRIRLLVEKDKIAASKAKFETAMKNLNKHGGLDKVMGQLVNKFLGDGTNQVEIKPPAPKKPKPMQVVSLPQERVQAAKIEEEAMKKEIAKQLEEEMRVSPLYTSCNCLKLSLNQDEQENPDNSVKEFIKDTLSEELYEDLNDLLNSENEEDAKNNLKNLQENISMEEYPKLLEIQGRLTEGQRKIIGNILNYREKDE